jgi:hypothetical protein
MNAVRKEFLSNQEQGLEEKLPSLVLDLLDWLAQMFWCGWVIG